MTIVGVGLDATEVPRIEQSIERFGDRFLKRVFTDGEIAYCNQRRHPAQHFAGRFAAKEAGMKALGTGHSRGILWRDIEVTRRSGPPQLLFHRSAARRYESLRARQALLTITHTDALAIAHVMLLGS